MFDRGYFDRSKAYTVRRGKLPHWRQDEALYFVTFRLADSIPETKLNLLRTQREEWLRFRPEPHAESELEEYWRLFVKRIETWLDRGYGSCALRDDGAKRIIEQALGHFDGDRYALLDRTVASNHVHAIVQTAAGVDLSEIEQSWKSYSAKALFGLDHVKRAFPTRRVWHAESFDHIVRNESRLEAYVQYIRNHERS